MMKLKNINVILTTVSFILFSLAFWVNDPFSLFVSNYETADHLIEKTLKLQEVERIIVEKDSKILLSFYHKSDSNNDWSVKDAKNKGEYQVKASLIEEGFDHIVSIKKFQEVTSSKDNHAKFEVDDKSGLKVSFLKGDATKPLLAIYLGKSGTNFNSTLVRLASDDSIYSAKGNLKSDWEQEVDHFRDKSLFDLVPANINSLELSGARSYTVSKNKLNEWEIKSKVVPIPVLGKQDKVNEILKKICELEASSFVDLAKPSGKKYANVNLMLADKSKVSLNIFGPDSQDMYFAKSSQRSYGVLLAKWKLDSIFVTFDELKDIKEKVPQIPTK